MRRIKVTKEIISGLFHAFHDKHGVEHYLDGLFRRDLNLDAEEASAVRDPIKASLQYGEVTPRREQFDRDIKHKRATRAKYRALGLFLIDVGEWLSAASEEAETWEEFLVRRKRNK